MGPPSDPLRQARREAARRRTRRNRRLLLAAVALTVLVAAGAVIAAPRLLDDASRQDTAAATTDASTGPAPAAASGAASTAGETVTAQAPAPLREGSAATPTPPAEAGAAAAEAARPPTRSAARPLAGLRVNLDPGHNGGNTAAFNAGVPAPTQALIDAGVTLSSPRCDTSGAATNDGYRESAFNLDLATRARAVLEARGATVTLTRSSNDTQGPCTAVRAAIGNRADVALSIHADGGPPGGRGFHVIEPGLLAGYTDDIRAASSRLGTALRDAMRGTGMPDSTYIGSAGLDVRTDLVGLVLSDTPKVFLETGNMRNAADARLLGSASFRDAVATAIADAVVAWRRSR